MYNKYHMILTKNDLVTWLEADGRGIELFGEYINTQTKTTFRCKNGHQWDARPTTIKQGNGCPGCAGQFPPSNEEIQEWLKSNNKNFTLIGDLQGTHKKSKFQCNLGHQWEASLSNIKGGSGCPSCSSQRLLTKEEMTEWLYNDGRGISILGEYLGSKIKTKFCCSFNHQWSATPKNIRAGKSCPECSVSGFKSTKPGWAYVIMFPNFIKYGITNDPKSRLGDHKQVGDYTVMYLRHHELGQSARDWENKIRKSYLL
jgi:hypothetical protein